MKKILMFFRKKDRKSKNLINNVVISFIIKGIGLFVALFTMPSYIKFFDNELVLGVWFTALSILNWILTFDFGISNGLRNLLVEPLKKNNEKEIKYYISSTYFSILIIVLIFLVTSLIVFPHLNWNNLFNISPNIVNEKTMLFMCQVLFIGVLCNFLLNIINSIFYAMQKSFVPSLNNLISTILILIFINLFNSSDITTNIYSLSIVNAVFSNITLIILTIVLFSTKLKKCRPNIHYFSTKYAKKIINLGLTFFLLQILTVLMYGVNEILISNLTVPSNVVQYQAYNKIFSLISTLFNLAITPVWSAIRESCIEKDVAWIKRIHKNFNIIFIVLVIGEFAIIPMLQFILDIWLGKGYIEVNYLYAIIFALASLAQMKMIIESSFSNGFGYLKIQVIAMLVTTIIKFALSITLVKIYKDWIYIILATFISIIPFIIIEHFDIKKQIKKLECSNEAKSY